MTEETEEKKQALLEARLENWGNWARDRKRQGTSSTWGILKHIGFKPDYEDEADQLHVDALDALTINRAWAAMPDGPEKAFILQRYVNGGSGFDALKTIRMNKREECKRRAYLMISNLLKRSRCGTLEPTI